MAHHPDIAWASALVLAPDGIVVEAGRVVGPGDCSAPLFRGASLHTYGWFGGAQWYRNASAASPLAIALKPAALAAALRELANLGAVSDGVAFTTLCRHMRDGGLRGLVDPHARAWLPGVPTDAWPNEGSLFAGDPHFHPAFSKVNPLELQS